MKNICKDQNGGVLLFFLMLVPILLLGFSLFSLRWAHHLDSAELRGLCRLELRDGMAKAGQKIEALLKLNPAIRALRIEKKAAMAALVAALAANPPAVPAARAWVKSVEFRQQALQVKQQLLLVQGRFALAQMQRRSTAVMKPTFRSLGLARRELRRLRFSAATLAVRAADRDPTLPEYELKPRFEEAQNVELKWLSQFRSQSYQPSGGRHTWTRLIPTLSAVEIPESCGMTLKPNPKRPGAFLPAPTQAKYF